MALRYPHLLSPLCIGGQILKNRMVYPNASPHFLQGPETFPAEGFRAFLTGLAKNGAAMITVGDWALTPSLRSGDAASDASHVQAFDLHDPSVHNYLSMMADEVHMFGAKLILNTLLDMPDGYSLDGSPIRAPGLMGRTFRPLPIELVPQVIEQFIEKLKFYKALGYDGVTMRLDGVLCQSEAPRDDMFGGSLENRTRLHRMAYLRAKEVLGPDFITEAALAGEQPMGYTGNSRLGYTLEDTIAFAHLVEGTVDILQLREKDMPLAHPTGYTHRRGEHGTIAYAQAIKESGCSILTQPLGGFQDPALMERCLAEGKCDLFGLARAFIADFSYGKKLLAGRGEDIRPCIRCNKCHGTIRTPRDPWLSVCSVNPEMGLGGYIHRLRTPPGSPQNIAVIGGGPAGMAAAIFAAEKGHRVTLYEASGYLGGQMIHAEHFSFKWPIQDYRSWLVRRLEQLGITVHLHTRAVPEEIASLGYDAIFAATGAIPVQPAGIAGLTAGGEARFPNCLDILGKEAALGQHIAIIGGSESGVETAMHLCELGHTVTVLTRQDEIGHNCSKLHSITMAWVKPHGDGYGHMAPAWEKYPNLHAIPNAVTLAVTPNTVSYRDSAGKTRTLDVDSIVICGGMKPATQEALAFSGCADRFFAIGDCNGAGNIQRCTRDAWGKVQML